MKKHLITQFTLIGFLCGMAFPAIAWAVDLYRLDLPLKLSSLTTIHQNNALHYVIDAAPVLLSFIFFTIATFYTKALKKTYSSSSTLLLNTILETMVDGFITIDDRGTVLSYNRGAENIFGYKEKEIRGRNVSVLMTETDSKEQAQYLASYRKTGVNHISETSGREVRAKRKDGSIFPLTITISEMFIDEKRRFVGVLRDITDVKLAQAESARVADELTQLVDTANAPIFGIDSDGLVNEWNQTAARITGYQKSEVLGKDLVAEFITDEYKAPVKQVLDDALHGDETANYEFPLYTRDGQRVDVLLNATTRRDVDGEITGVIGVGQDITEAKSAQAESISVAEELTQLVDTANAPIFGIDSDGLVNEWNQTAARITGYQKSEVLGKDLVAEFITDEYKAPVKQVLDDALHGDETANYEFPLYTRDGQRVDVLLNATTRRDVDGEITGVIGVGQDITELRKNERALNQSRKMETVGQLTGGIAHDFNNLLSIIGGNLRFLQQDIGDVSIEIAELIEDAMSATNDGADLTARLLAFSRNRILKPELKDVNDTIETFSRFLSRALGKTIDLKTELPDDHLFINVDASQLENALLNLAINARDAMPEGGNIVIKAARYSVSGSNAEVQKSRAADIDLQPGNYVVVVVEDIGTGISDEHLGHVYEPFFTTKDVGKGSGLGLSMVYGFIQQSNGQCVIRSEVGKGTTVSMYFPEAKSTEGTHIQLATRAMESAGSEVILVVEDEPRVRRITVRDLEKLGYSTLEASDATAAQKIIESGEKIDLVFTDVLMPGEMDGQMLGLWIENTHPEIRVVLTSGYTKRRDTKGTVFPLVRKPYKIDALAKQLSITLDEA